MDDSKTPKQPEVGPIGHHLIDAVEELRALRGLSYRRLSEELERVGRPIFRLGLSRLAKGDRRVDVDELVALAVVLGVNPSALLFPRHVQADDVVRLTSTVEQRASVVWGWADGKLPLPETMPEAGTTEVETPADQMADFTRTARPDTSSMAEVDPAFREAYNLAARIHVATQDFANPVSWDMRRDMLIRAYRMVGLMLEELIAKGDRELMQRSSFKFDSAGAAEQLRAAAGTIRPPAMEHAPPVPEPGPHAAPTTVRFQPPRTEGR